MQECSTTLPLTSSRDFIHSILCRRIESCIFYQRPCIDGTCPRCGGMEFLDKLIHVTDEHELGIHEVNLQSFKYVTYDIGGGMKEKKYNWSPLRLVTISWIVFFSSYSYFIYLTTYWSVHIYFLSTRYWYATSWRNSLKRHNSM